MAQGHWNVSNALPVAAACAGPPSSSPSAVSVPASITLASQASGQDDQDDDDDDDDVFAAAPDDTYADVRLESEEAFFTLQTSGIYLCGGGKKARRGRRRMDTPIGGEHQHPAAAAEAPIR